MPIEKSVPKANSAFVPVEGPVPAAVTPRGNAGQNPSGGNNEQLPERLQVALRRLVQQYSVESESTRRQEVRRIKQAHQFWRGLQYLWWNERDQNWHVPFEQKLADGSSLEDLPRYEFATNIYQAFGLSLVSVLSQDVPRVRFFPSSAQAEEDVAAAKAATEVAQLVERNNRVGNLIVEEAFSPWTDGKVGAYVRFVVDGQWFGFHPETEIGAREVRVGEDVYVCPDCGTEQKRGLDGDGLGEGGNRREVLRRSAPLDDGQNRVGDETQNSETGGATDGAGVQDSATVNCDLCGALLTEEDFVAAVTVPAAETRMRVPNGQEVVTMVGGLELKTPPWANEMHEYPYLQWNMEVHQARLRAAYPHAAEKIGAPVASGGQEYERLARLGQSQGGPLTEGGDININLITFQRTWLRPWAFLRWMTRRCATSCWNCFQMERRSRLRAMCIANRARKYRRPLARAARAAGRWVERASGAGRFADQRAGAFSIRFRICRWKRTSMEFPQFTRIAKFWILMRCRARPLSRACTIRHGRNRDSR